MENVEYPASLIYPDAKIDIYFEEKIQTNKTKSAIIISGNQNGFLALSNLINVYSVYLVDPIILTDFSFVTSKLKFEIKEDLESILPNGCVVRKSNEYFKWKLSEINLCVCICLIHSLGYANKELHFDTDLQPNDISVYCVLD